ncbi:MAG: alpha/beta hydrolase [Acidimicrobiia bacterium]
MTTSHTVEIPARDATLAGTLMVPSGDGPFSAALLVAGSGPLDRDGNHKRLSLGVSLDLAELLADAGWASLRYDKRGVGESSGDYLSTGFYDELDDAISALEWLQSQPAVNQVVPIGHSVGALFAAEMSARGLTPDGAALLSYTINTGEGTLIWQAGEIGQTVPGWIKTLMGVFGTSIEKQQAKALTKLTSTTDDVARIQMQKINAKWMREFIAYDPQPVLRSTETPVLAITGSKDVQVNPADIAAVAEITGDRGTAVVIPDVDHILREETGPISNPKKYKQQLQKPIDPRVAEALVAWLETVTPATSPAG